MNEVSLKQIILLPDELIRYILLFVPIRNLVFVNKTYYYLYHKCIKSYISNYNSFIIDMIRRDNDFVFKQLINENYKTWISKKKIYYKNKVFSNYIFFTNDLCIQEESTLCRELISNVLKQQGISQNLHKKNICRHIRWKK
jgi:hypothetical protein